MTDLFEKSIQILELPKVLERLAGQAVTQEGKERCLALRPMTTRTMSSGRWMRPAPLWT